MLTKQATYQHLVFIALGINLLFSTQSLGQSCKTYLILGESESALDFKDSVAFSNHVQLHLTQAIDHGYALARYDLEKLDTLEKGCVQAQYRWIIGTLILCDTLTFPPEFPVKAKTLEALIHWNKKGVFRPLPRTYMVYPEFQLSEPTYVFSSNRVTFTPKITLSKLNRFQALLGWQPATTVLGVAQKNQILGNAEGSWFNAFHRLESLEFQWQRQTVQTQRLQAVVDIPFIAGLPLGVRGEWNAYKKESYFGQSTLKGGLWYRPRWHQRIGWNYERVLNILLGQTGSSFQSTWSGPSCELTSASHHPSKMQSQFKIQVLQGVRHVYSADSTAIQRHLFKANMETGLEARHHKLFVRTFLYAGLLPSIALNRIEYMRLGGSSLLRGFAQESLYCKRYGVWQADIGFKDALNNSFFVFTDLGILTMETAESWAYCAGVGTYLKAGNGQLQLLYGWGWMQNQTWTWQNALLQTGYRVTF